MMLIHIANGSGEQGGKAIAINPSHIIAVFPQGNGLNRIIFDTKVPCVTESGQLSVTDPIEDFVD